MYITKTLHKIFIRNKKILYIDYITMKISLLLIVAMCLVAFAYAAKPKFDFNKENGCTAERHGWINDAHEEVCEKRVHV